MKKNIAIIHYNTPYLTECLVRSINLFVKEAIIHIFDNSDKFPFTAKFDNVTIFDNTKGQIIDFNAWLEKYPNRKKSPAFRNNELASAKHCYSVEVCMNLIKDSFILLDSDILLKKDFSDLFSDGEIFVGEVANQPNSSIKRVLPFMCYINYNMCKEHNVHFFNDNYMHGLYNNSLVKTADLYDTGAGFYLSAKQYNHKTINLDDYIIHYGHGSWDKKGISKKPSQEEWANIHKSLWSEEKNKKVIYTCITGDYDNLIEPKYITEGFDYICFTDSKTISSNIWQIKSLPNEISGLSDVKKQRYIKINPHKVLSEYDLSIWVDGNVTIKGDLNKALENYIQGKEESVFVPQHPKRNCIYDEAKAVVLLKKDNEANVKPQVKRYELEGFPRKYGLLQSNILIRKHNNPDCIKLMEAWFEEVKNNSHRDQLSFNYASWKNNDVKVVYLDKMIYASEWFRWVGGHVKTSKNSNKAQLVAQEKLRILRELREKRQKRIKENNERIINLHYMY